MHIWGKTHEKAPWSTSTNHILQCKVPAVGGKKAAGGGTIPSRPHVDGLTTPTDAGV